MFIVRDIQSSPPSVPDCVDCILMKMQCSTKGQSASITVSYFLVWKTWHSPWRSVNLLAYPHKLFISDKLWCRDTSRQDKYTWFSGYRLWWCHKITRSKRHGMFCNYKVWLIRVYIWQYKHILCYCNCFRDMLFCFLSGHKNRMQMLGLLIEC